MNILALETSTEACSVALLNTQGQLFEEFKITPREHTRYLPLMLNSVLTQAKLQRDDIDCVSFANGPGAFTGVRIAAATAQGLALGLSRPVMGISTLAVLAQQATETLACDSVLAALDARMGEVYLAQYQRNKNSGLVELNGEERLIKLQDMKLLENTQAVGNGFQAWQEAGLADSHKVQFHADIYPTAAALVRLARQAIDNKMQTSPADVKINYIRNKVAEKKKTA